MIWTVESISPEKRGPTEGWCVTATCPSPLLGENAGISTEFFVPFSVVTEMVEEALMDIKMKTIYDRCD